ncbi:MAG: DAK2 domain-containing protein [Actinomycetia bacterium]|nr:DAK2 domain-containing protein [Actinomycetes bacterium]
MADLTMTPKTAPSAVDLIAAAAEALKARKEEINRLNVFPVPDGDTGTNMSLTMDAVMAELSSLGPEAVTADICHAVTHGSLMGARGNSGVILSQILRGLCEAVVADGDASGVMLADALSHAVTVAFQAVRKPVEGTMLTVLKDMAEAVRSGLAASASLDELLDMVVKAAFESVRRGPELLPVLKEHGVVDAGGFGLAILAEGFVTGLEGHVFSDRDIAVATGELTVSPVNDWDDQEYLYCTEFLMYGADADKPFIEEWISAHGGSDLVVGDRETYKIHVHTDDPGTVLAWATSLGEVGEVHINNMRRQTAERSEMLRSTPAPTAPPKPIGFVAVSSGPGLSEILRSLGVDEIVNGGQTMNPSTAEILEAVQKVHAEKVILFPNNSNIILAAQQVIGVSERPVAVVPTTSVPQAFAALLSFDGSDMLDDVVEEMTGAAAAVRTGEVTTAVKDSTGKAGTIRAGQIIGIADHEIEVIGDAVEDVTLRLIDVLADDAETLTLLAGEDLDDDALARIAADAASAHPDLEVETHRGGQPLYPVILALE